MQDKIEIKKIHHIMFAVAAALLAYPLIPVLFLVFRGQQKQIGRFYHQISDIFTLPIEVFSHYLLLGVLSYLLLFVFMYFVVWGLVIIVPRRQKLHGDAKFANSADVAKMDLYGDKGIIIGKYNNKLLRFGGSQFVSLGAPTRTGKGVGIVIPNLMDWVESCVVQDIKQECFNFASKYRQDKLNQEVYLFNPFDKRTHRYNPLHYIDLGGDNGDAELVDLANIIYPVEPGSQNAFWQQQAQNLFKGLCYLLWDLLHTFGGLELLKSLNINISWSLYDVLWLSEGFKVKVSNSNNQTIELNNFSSTWEYIKSVNETNFNTYKILCQKSIDCLESFCAFSAEETKSSILGSFNAPLGMFRGDNMRLATSGNDFDFRDLRKKKMTIFIGITPDQLANAKQILNFFWQQLILVNTKELPQDNKELKYKVMLLMDEFTASGYLPTYLKGISFIAGYGLRSVMIYQSNSQLETPTPNGYGKEGAQTLLSNHACQIFYTPREIADAEKLSKLLGDTTTKNRSKNISSSILDYKGGGSESDTRRALMLPQELMVLPADKEILKIDNNKPVLAKKAYYYNDKYFIDKFKEISPTFKTKAQNLGTLIPMSLWEEMLQSGETKSFVPTQSFEKFKKEQEEMLNTLRNDYQITPQEQEKQIFNEDLSEQEIANLNHNELVEDETQTAEEVDFEPVFD